MTRVGGASFLRNKFNFPANFLGVLFFFFCFRRRRREPSKATRAYDLQISFKVVVLNRGGKQNGRISFLPKKVKGVPTAVEFLWTGTNTKWNDIMWVVCVLRGKNFYSWYLRFICPRRWQQRNAYDIWNRVIWSKRVFRIKNRIMFLYACFCILLRSLSIL